MADMILFSRTVLSEIAVFLGSEPIIYLYGMILSLFVVKIFLMIVRNDTKW